MTSLMSAQLFFIEFIFCIDILTTDTIFHTNSYGYCETVSYRWNKSKQSCRKEKGMKSAVKPHVCSNKHSLVS